MEREGGGHDTRVQEKARTERKGKGKGKRTRRTGHRPRQGEIRTGNGERSRRTGYKGYHVGGAKSPR